MPRALAATPRKMLPPPMTIAVSTPIALDLGDVLGDLRRDGRIDAVGLLAHQGFAGEFQEDAFVGGAGGGVTRSDYSSGGLAEASGQWLEAARAIEPLQPEPSPDAY